jgi:hypothetical protein
MAWTSTDVDNLKQAIADGRGARSMTFGDQSVTFNSIAEMLQLLSMMQQEVNTTAGRSKSIRYAATSKGF